MKPFPIILLILSSVFMNCKKEEDKTDEYLLLLGLASQQGIYDSVECQKHYTMNPVYIPSGSAQKFSSDFKQYKNVWIGDSSVAFSQGFSGFYNPEVTQINAVGGDQLCDYNARFTRSIKTQNPEWIITQTVGGNDFLRQQPDNIIIDTFADYSSRLRERFPNTKFCWVKVHPSTNSYANSARNRLTQIFQTYTKGDKWVNVDACFSDPVTVAQLPDGIHFSEATALCVKNQIQIQCGVSL